MKTDFQFKTGEKQRLLARAWDDREFALDLIRFPSIQSSDIVVILEYMLDRHDAGEPISRKDFISKKLVKPAQMAAYDALIMKASNKRGNTPEKRIDVAAEAYARLKQDDSARKKVSIASKFKDMDFSNVNEKELFEYIESKDGNSNGLVLKGLDDYTSKPVDWLWDQKLVSGGLNMLVGMPDQGKSICTMDIATRVTTGEAFPNDKPRKPARAILFASEDKIGETTKNRLIAAGVNKKLLHILEGVKGKHGNTDIICLDEHLHKLRQVFEQFHETEHPVRLLVIDPISNFMGTNRDTYKDNEVRKVLTPLARLAEEYNVCVLMVSHFNKDSKGKSTMDRVMGSRAFTGICRCVYSISSHDIDENKRIFAKVKNNIAKDSPSLVYSIHAKSVMTDVGLPTSEPVLKWEAETIEGNADKILNKAEADPVSQVGKCCKEIEQIVKGKQYVVPEYVMSKLSEDYSSSALNKAKKKLGIQAKKKKGFGEGWEWVIPTDLAYPDDETPIEITSDSELFGDDEQ